MEILGILFLVFVVMISIGLHEIGHLAPAKKFGVKVTQYMIGFGPTIWSKKKGDTEYGLKAIPLGGYIRMIGMVPPPRDGKDATGPFAEIVNTARKQSMDEIEPGDENKVFYKLSVPKKLTVMVGGPFMNLVLAFVFFAISFSAIGFPAATNQVKQVVSCLPSDVDVLGDCLVGTTSSPALAAGIKAGDEIVKFSGKEITNWEELASAIQNSRAESVAISVLREGKIVELNAEIVNAVRPQSANATVENKPAPYLGIAPQIIMEKQPISSVFQTLGEITVGTGKVLWNLPNRVATLQITGISAAAISPPTLVTPTIPTKPSGSLCSPKNAAPNNWLTLFGKFHNTFPVPTVISPKV